MDIEEVNLLMVGLDNAGKTKLLYTLKCGSVDETISTIGYNVESIEYNGIKYTIWDIGGLKTVRVLRNFYIDDKDAVIYVVDASNVERFEETQKDLHDLMDKSDLKDVPLLIVANKMDLVPEFDVECLAELLKLPCLNQKWHIEGVSALKDGTKLFKIFDTLKTRMMVG